MIDIKKIVHAHNEVLERLRRRDPTISLNDILDLYQEKAPLQYSYESLLRQINSISKGVSKLDRTTTDFEDARETSKTFWEQSRAMKERLDLVSRNLEKRLLEIPNVVLDNVPVSQNKEDKEIVHYYGDKPIFDFPPLDHVILCERLGLIDFERGTKIAGPGFPLYTGKGAVLEWALINFMIDNARKNGFEFILPPILNNTASLVSTGNLPKFQDEIYSCKNDNLHLIPTAETPITNLYRNEILDAEKLPMRIVAYTPCFRREAGAAGKITHGLMRLHQFNKLESYSICLPDQAKSEHELLINNGEQILKDLKLPFRLANLPSCDLAQQSAQTFDIEIWLPVLEQYSEVSSASNCLDYQARRANIRYRTGKEKGFVTTLNCSALATPRVMIALLENNQTSDGHIKIPEPLVKYTGFDVI